MSELGSMRARVARCAGGPILLQVPACYQWNWLRGPNVFGGLVQQFGTREPRTGSNRPHWATAEHNTPMSGS